MTGAHVSVGVVTIGAFQPKARVASDLPRHSAAAHRCGQLLIQPLLDHRSPRREAVGLRGGQGMLHRSAYLAWSPPDSCGWWRGRRSGLRPGVPGQSIRSVRTGVGQGSSSSGTCRRELGASIVSFIDHCRAVGPAEVGSVRHRSRLSNNAGPASGRGVAAVHFDPDRLAFDRAMPDELLQLWQAHWRIESSCWLRHAIFREDQSTRRTAHAHQMFAALRNVVIARICL